MKKRIRVVIDTNIFIDGWFSDKPNAIKVLEMVDNRDLLLLFSQETIGELVYIAKNFARHNIDLVSEQIEFLKEIMALFYFAISVNTMETECPKIIDRYDEMFLKCAIEGKADYIISDDFKSGIHDIKRSDIKVVSSTNFVKELDQIAIK